MVLVPASVPPALDDRRTPPPDGTSTETNLVSAGARAANDSSSYRRPTPSTYAVRRIGRYPFARRGGFDRPTQEPYASPPTSTRRLGPPTRSATISLPSATWRKTV